jgi:Rrf2 family protein
MQISAKVDYAVRAMLELAKLQSMDHESVITAESIAKAQAVPLKFLEGILRDLRRAGYVSTTRGPDGGYRLGCSAKEISVADVIRAIDGPLAEVRGEKPEDAQYSGASEHLGDVWIAVRASLRSVLETTNLSDLINGKLSPQVIKSLKDPEAWTRR